MLKILSIGNSFSYDAQRYLYAISKANGKDIKNVNLYIGGCPLKKHYINMLENNRAYGYGFRGELVGISCSIKEALISDDWDYVTVQQASHCSYNFDSYNPYIEKLCEYIAKYSPKSKILLHQTWAYPDHSAKNQGFESSEQMFEAVKQAYDKAFDLIKPYKVIRSGEAMIKAYREKNDSIYHDTLHSSMGFGRYMLGIVWFKTLFGEVENFKHINEFDAVISNEEKELAYKIAYNL